jgi:SWI/SNF-related matrix-associated actin-dependent regulator of chromatin subfamily A member 5
MQKQKRKADDNELHKKHKEMDKTDVTCVSLAIEYRDSSLLFQLADTIKCYSYLFGKTELFKHFVGIKVLSMCSLSQLNLTGQLESLGS